MRIYIAAAVVVLLTACGGSQSDVSKDAIHVDGDVMIQHPKTETDTTEGENPVHAIAKRWADASLKVNVTDGRKARIRDFAQALCYRFAGFEPNKILTDYIKDPNAFRSETSHYRIDDAESNGFMQCDMLTQFTTQTQICYWKRTNGHRLVALWMDDEHEGNSRHALLAFYDYDPNTKTLTPDMKVTEEVRTCIAKTKPDFDKGDSYSVNLPKKDKDIALTIHRLKGEDAYDNETFGLIWANDTFSIE